MAAKEADLKRVDLKVFVNCCEGCKRKVLKALSIKGVLKVEIHPTHPKVTVISDVNTGVLVKKLLKVGKSAEVLNETAQTTQEKTNPDYDKHDKSSIDTDKIKNSKNKEDISEAMKGMNPTTITAIPQMGLYSTMVPHAQVYCPTKPIVVPIPCYAMTVHPTPVTYYIQDYRYYETLAYRPPPPQSQVMTTFGDYFDEDNTAGCRIM